MGIRKTVTKYQIRKDKTDGQQTFKNSFETGTSKNVERKLNQEVSEDCD